MLTLATSSFAAFGLLSFVVLACGAVLMRDHHRTATRVALTPRDHPFEHRAYLDI